MPLAEWWQMRHFVDWRLGWKTSDSDDIDFDAEGWGDG